MRVGSAGMRLADADCPSVLQPLFVTGFFRSGTSLATHVLSELGMDIGPREHLLQSRGTRSALNRDGFFENYLFMDASLYCFDKLNAWGHIPPVAQDVKRLDFSKEDAERFPWFSVCAVHDDRISNKNKVMVLKNYGLLSLDRYLADQFRFPMAIKNPHFSVLSGWITKKWPDSRFLVCFRNPFDAIASAAKITSQLNEDIYCRYYEDFFSLPSGQVLFFSYDRLMEEPVKSISVLADHFDLNKAAISDALKLVDAGQHRFMSDQKCSEKTENLYRELIKRSAN